MRTHREAANSSAHGGIYDDVIIDIEQVAVFANAVVQLLAVVRHLGAQQVPPVLHHHAVLLHLCPCYQAPAMNPRLHHPCQAVTIRTQGVAGHCASQASMAYIAAVMYIERK